MKELQATTNHKEIEAFQQIGEMAAQAPEITPEELVELSKMLGADTQPLYMLQKFQTLGLQRSQKGVSGNLHDQEQRRYQEWQDR